MPLEDDIAQKKFEEFAQAYKYDMTRDDEGEYVKQSTWKAFVAFQNGFVDGYEAGCRESTHECGQPTDQYQISPLD